jgi:hypothetical protein
MQNSALVRPNLPPATLTPPSPKMLPGMLRPFERSDFAPLPKGWRAGPPDFVAVGCGRAGSTWWWSLIERHPKVVPNRLGQKELHYFSHFGWNGPSDEQVEVYREAFAAPPGSICGDGTFAYLTHPLSVQHLWRAAPETRLIALLRNPIDRFVSSYDRFLRHRMRWLGLDGERAVVQRNYSLWDEALTSCLCADGLRAVQRRWPRERLLVLQYEKCRLDPERELARTYEFLGLDPRFVPEGLREAINKEEHELAGPDAAARERLVELFERDVAETCRLCPEVDRSLWTDFA